MKSVCAWLLGSLLWLLSGPSQALQLHLDTEDLSPAEYSGAFSPAGCRRRPESVDQTTTPLRSTPCPSFSSRREYSTPMFRRRSAVSATPPRLMLMISTREAKTIRPWTPSTTKR